MPPSPQKYRRNPEKETSPKVTPERRRAGTRREPKVRCAGDTHAYPVAPTACAPPRCRLVPSAHLQRHCGEENLALEPIDASRAVQQHQHGHGGRQDGVDHGGGGGQAQVGGGGRVGWVGAGETEEEVGFGGEEGEPDQQAGANCVHVVQAREHAWFVGGGLGVGWGWGGVGITWSSHSQPAARGVGESSAPRIARPSLSPSHSPAMTLPPPLHGAPT